MALNIKNEEAERLSRQVAARTGESLTTAIAVSLRERLVRLDAAPAESDARIERIRRVARDIAPALAASPLSIDDLYDENGLPA